MGFDYVFSKPVAVVFLLVIAVAIILFAIYHLKKEKK